MEEIQHLAIVADLHANKYALDAFLDYLDAQFPVDNILNVGDSVNIGPHPQEVVSKIMQDSRFMSILGNNDEAMWETPSKKWTKNEILHTLWTREQIGGDLLKKFSELPKFLSIQINHKTLFLTHLGVYHIKIQIYRCFIKRKQFSNSRMIIRSKRILFFLVILMIRF